MQSVPQLLLTSKCESLQSLTLTLSLFRHCLSLNFLLLKLRRNYILKLVYSLKSALSTQVVKVMNEVTYLVIKINTSLTSIVKINNTVILKKIEMEILASISLKPLISYKMNILPRMNFHVTTFPPCRILVKT